LCSDAACVLPNRDEVNPTGSLKTTASLTNRTIIKFIITAL